MMKALPISLAAALGLTLAGAAVAQPKASAQSKPLYVRIGCNNCHGDAGQGSIAGPRLAPGPIGFEAFEEAVRRPRLEMPAYSEKALPDAQLREIHAYLGRIRDGAPSGKAR